MPKISRPSYDINISNRTIIRIIVWVVGTAIAYKIILNMIHPLTLLFVSFFLAMALNPIVTFLARRLASRSRTQATSMAYVAVVAVLIGFISLVVPPLVAQTAEFIGDVPQTLKDLEDDDGAVGNFVRRYELESQITDFANNWASDISAVSDRAVTTASRVISNIVSILTVLVLTFMMLVEGPYWMKAFWKVYPNDNRKHAQKIAYKMYNVVTNYVNGQVLVAAIGASFSIVVMFIATTIFDVSNLNVVALGGIVFLCSLIPTIGAILSASIVVLFSLFVSPPLSIAMLIYFIIYQQIENVSIQPYIQSRGNELTPMLVFIAALLGIGFGGVLGAFIAIPAAGCAKVLIDDFLKKNNYISENK